MKNCLFNYLLIIVICNAIFQKAIADQEGRKDQQDNYQQSICSNRVVLSLTLPKNCVSGDAIPLVISLKNQGDTNVYFVRGALFCYDAFVIKLLNSKGETISFTKYGTMYPPGSAESFGRRGMSKLAPGKEIAMHVNLARIYDLTIPGEYVFYIKTAVSKDTSMMYNPGDIHFVIDNFKFSISEPYNESRKIFGNPEYTP